MLLFDLGKNAIGNACCAASVDEIASAAPHLLESAAIGEQRSHSFGDVVFRHECGRDREEGIGHRRHRWHGKHERDFGLRLRIDAGDSYGSATGVDRDQSAIRERTVRCATAI